MPSAAARRAPLRAMSALLFDIAADAALRWRLAAGCRQMMLPPMLPALRLRYATLRHDDATLRYAALALS